jgi:hypothetical protein
VATAEDGTQAAVWAFLGVQEGGGVKDGARHLGRAAPAGRGTTRQGVEQGRTERSGQCRASCAHTHAQLTVRRCARSSIPLAQPLGLLVPLHACLRSRGSSSWDRHGARALGTRNGWRGWLACARAALVSLWLGSCEGCRPALLGARGLVVCAPLATATTGARETGHPHGATHVTRPGTKQLLLRCPRASRLPTCWCRSPAGAWVCSCHVRQGVSSACGRGPRCSLRSATRSQLVHNNAPHLGEIDVPDLAIALKLGPHLLGPAGREEAGRTHARTRH